MRMSDLNPAPSLFTIAPANRDHEVGIRCGITVLVPLLALLLMDRIDLAIFASFGAFTGIYGRNTTHGVRLHMQLRAGLLMIAVILAATLAGRSGVSESENPWALVGLTTVVAGVCAVIAGYWKLRPAGSLFHIFAFAAVVCSLNSHFALRLAKPRSKPGSTQIDQLFAAVAPAVIAFA